MSEGAAWRRVGGRWRRLLLVVAHPDDETMFFAPLLLACVRGGVQVHVLCLSSGDFYGEDGRGRELGEALERLGLDGGSAIVLDHHHLKDGSDWSPNTVSDLIIRHASMLDVDVVVTFDNYGVSGHPNHTRCYSGALLACQSMPLVMFYSLDSCPLLVKYVSVFCVPVCLGGVSFASSPRDVIRIWSAMRCHRSQFVWFRVLYMLFSRYVLVNTISVLPVPPQ